eukprot:CAMPEP_0196598580 /NCGR_PEP_ID=MMETSP1081-20130531/94398_1 /TAXON_ID=36882 /ORGANISM="Pyramimonas amylifera, Strain CCMP720" /LENGTH=127 /DNA_ID=CAMNT_0041924291 /DNA_START=550 /DNA_END=933 /DNA_ORIENTATION=+
MSSTIKTPERTLFSGTTICKLSEILLPKTFPFESVPIKDFLDESPKEYLGNRNPCFRGIFNRTEKSGNSSRSVSSNSDGSSCIGIILPAFEDEERENGCFGGAGTTVTPGGLNTESWLLFLTLEWLA